MPYEAGGRGDKSGNRYEIRYVILQLLEVLNEKIDYVILEALGDDEHGADLWIGKKDGTREAQQCKGRNRSKEYWDYGSLNEKGMFVKWKYQLERDGETTVALVSPLAFTLLEDIVARAKNTSEKPADFYKHQILSSSKEVNGLYNNFCISMELNPNSSDDTSKSISFLKRISYQQLPDSTMKQIILSKINLLLIGDEDEIYDAFITWIVDGDILGKKINLLTLCSFLNRKHIEAKDLSSDSRILPKILELNRQYRDLFIPLNDGLIERNEFVDCIKLIGSGESIIIHGRAGRGKSGCTEYITNHCLKENIPYVAIKLDKRIPVGTADKWGHDLGLPASIPHCLHSISKNEKAVIILDQLDALRWTQAHSRDSLLVCNHIIQQVKQLNYERKQNISIVFVCRTYDLENDNNIKALFKGDDKERVGLSWVKIKINEFDDDTVKSIIGKHYSNLTRKLKEIIRIPSNLYVWQLLEKNQDYGECATAQHLIFAWWTQLSRKCFEVGINKSDLNETKNALITIMEQSRRIFVPWGLINTNQSSLEYLSSNGFLLIQDGKISFAHQSILDCFTAEKMLKAYYDGKDIVEIIGKKEMQTPGRRYQVQMFLQYLSEHDSNFFLDVGVKMLNSQLIRYSIKFVFFEVLNQIDVLDEHIQNFIIKYCDDEKHSNHIISNVLFSRSQYVKLIREKGLLGKWLDLPEKKDIAISLFTSISPGYDKEDLAFIANYFFKNDDDDRKLSRCFSYDINDDTDELFELRMRFYDRYPSMAGHYIDIKEMLKVCEMRTIRLFAFLLANKIRNNEKSIARYEEAYLLEDSDFLIQNGVEVISLLLPFIPSETDSEISYSEWSGRYMHKAGLERTCIQIIKKANRNIINSSPEEFWKLYEDCMGKGNSLYNEIILDAFFNLSEQYSNRIIDYLCDDFDNNLFEITSGNGDELLMVKLVLEKHSIYCDSKLFDVLEESIISYISPRAKDIYRRRIEYNKDGHSVYWSFWGDLQKELLWVLPAHRMSKHAKDLMLVLERKYPEGADLYKYLNGHSGWVSSPIAGKKISDKKWLQILSNKKIAHKRSSQWREVPGGFVESSIEQFSISFRSVVSDEPERMIQMFTTHGYIVPDKYIDSLFSGVAHSKKLKDIPVALLEILIQRYTCDNASYRASYICSIIEARANEMWSQEIIDILKDIAENHKNPEGEKPNVTSNDDKEMRSINMLRSNALNCVRGNAARAIASLLWDNKLLLSQFKEVIERLTLDENPAVRFASLFALWPSYNIDREWASEIIMRLLEHDYRYAGFYDARDMLFRLYPEYGKRTLDIIEKCYCSDDSDLVEMGAYCLTEMYILNNEFSDIITNVEAVSEAQAKSILHIIVFYFKYEKYNSLAKKIILSFKTSSHDLEIPISRLFYDNRIDLERDREFLVDLMGSDVSRRVLHAFSHYLEDEAKSVIDFQDIIIAMSYHLLRSRYNIDDTDVRGVEEAISKLVIGLYDEVASSVSDEHKTIADECLDIWDLMFEKQIGAVRMLSKEIMDR